MEALYILFIMIFSFLYLFFIGAYDDILLRVIEVSKHRRKWRDRKRVRVRNLNLPKK